VNYAGSTRTPSGAVVDCTHPFGNSRRPSHALQEELTEFHKVDRGRGAAAFEMFDPGTPNRCFSVTKSIASAHRRKWLEAVSRLSTSS